MVAQQVDHMISVCICVGERDLDGGGGGKDDRRGGEEGGGVF